MPLLRAGEDMPHVTIAAAGRGDVEYARLWQKKNLLLVVAADAVTAGAIATSLAARRDDIAACDAEALVTAGAVPGVPRPGVLVADRWGEIFFVGDRLLPPEELIEWLSFVQRQCPECRGEAR